MSRWRDIRPLLLFLVLALAASPALVRPAAAAEPAGKAKAMREVVYEKLSRAQAAADAKDWAKAFGYLDDLAKLKDLAPHEKSQLHTAYGYTYFAQGKLTESAAAYERVLKLPELSAAMKASTLYTLGQLHFHLEHYDVALGHLQTWLKDAENPGPEPYILVGQALYQLGRLGEAAAPVERAVAVAQSRGQKIQENWYALLRVIYFETGKFEQLLDVLEILVAEYPSREYWLHLAAAFGETGQPARQLAAYELAYAQGFLRSGAEIVLLCQLLLQAEVPYRAGELLQEGLTKGTIASTPEHWRLLSQAWTLAQEHDAALVSLRKAAELSTDGELHARIAQLQANLGRWEAAAAAAATALERGVGTPHEVHLLQGMAYFELGRFPEARQSFERALKSTAGREQASRWLAYLEREEQRLQELGLRP